LFTSNLKKKIITLVLTLLLVLTVLPVRLGAKESLSSISLITSHETDFYTDSDLTESILVTIKLDNSIGSIKSFDLNISYDQTALVYSSYSLLSFFPYKQDTQVSTLNELIVTKSNGLVNINTSNYTNLTLTNSSTSFITLIFNVESSIYQSVKFNNGYYSSSIYLDSSTSSYTYLLIDGSISNPIQFLNNSSLEFKFLNTAKTKIADSYTEFTPKDINENNLTFISVLTLLIVLAVIIIYTFFLLAKLGRIRKEDYSNFYEQLSILKRKSTEAVVTIPDPIQTELSKDQIQGILPKIKERSQSPVRINNEVTSVTLVTDVGSKKNTKVFTDTLVRPVNNTNNESK
jgi:hypothetical protein